jgi:uncharacterized protein (TIGR03086 family)
MTDTLQLLERAIGQMGTIISAIRPGQANRPTPCPQWTVHDLVQHVVGSDLRNFTVSARGEAADWRAAAEPLGEDWLGQYRAGVGPLLEAWHAADLDATVHTRGGDAPMRMRADQQIAELATHGWDLVAATGADAPLDDELAEHSLAWSHGVLRPEFRGPDKAFGVEVPVAADAPAYDRLAGWFGRDPAWRPS